MVMSRNATAHFGAVPRADIQRSRFKRDSTHLTTMNAGSLIPIYLDEVLPGDTCTMDLRALVRMSTPIFPVMDNAFMDVYFFFVPNRLAWEHWKEFNGENNSTYWSQPTEYVVPTVTAPVSGDGGWNKGSIADYFGLPTNQNGIYVNAIPFRDYVLIWNEFFRDQNYMTPAHFLKNDAHQSGKPYVPGDRWDGITSAVHGGTPLPVSKVHDYFTSVLPAPQKGPSMEIPVFAEDKIPVGSFSQTHDASCSSLHFYSPNNLNGSIFVAASNTGYATGYPATGSSVVPSLSVDNLYADLNSVTIGTISQLRQAFQIQRLLERDARGGTRYTEILNAHFGVTSPDARLQRPEYLGGKRIPINIDQVIQTSATNDVSPQGNTAAFSMTFNRSSSFTKSFTEHGFIIGLACIRTDHTYQQGINKMWSRRNRFDYYWPALANISEQPVLRKEIFATTQKDENDSVFGYQEAWAEYRYKPSQVSGAFRSSYDGSLDSWHYADWFEANADAGMDFFVADRDFMAETPVNIDRTLAVSSDVEDQFLCDFYFDATWVRPMPLYSVPGLADHF